MAVIDNLLAELDERNQARLVGIPHGNARARYPESKITVDTFDEYLDALERYFNYHFSTCVSHGGRLSRADAIARVKPIIEREYRRRNGDFIMAYNDAREGTNGGLSAQLDMLSNALTHESLENMVREALDRHVKPIAWHEKVSLVREIFARFGSVLGPSIQFDAPERYAHDFQSLVMALSQAIQSTSAVLRRM
jgi:hypothetical protein